jgi:hypothetical protein
VVVVVVVGIVEELDHEGGGIAVAFDHEGGIAVAFGLGHNFEGGSDVEVDLEGGIVVDSVD